MKSKYIKNVTTLEVNKSLCIGCTNCVIVCPHQLLQIIEQKVSIINRDLCIECGACQLNCPTNAISVRVGVGCASAIYNSR